MKVKGFEEWLNIKKLSVNVLHMIRKTRRLPVEIATNPEQHFSYMPPIEVRNLCRKSEAVWMKTQNTLLNKSDMRTYIVCSPVINILFRNRSFSICSNWFRICQLFFVSIVILSNHCECFQIKHHFCAHFSTVSCALISLQTNNFLARLLQSSGHTLSIDNLKFKGLKREVCN